MDVLPLGLVGDGALRAAVAADREVTRMEGVRADHLAEYLGEAAENWVPPRVRMRGAEGLVALGGEGAPQVPEFAVCEVAAALNLSQPAASSLCADVLDLAYRLPRVAANVRNGELPFAKARLIARRTRELSKAQCELVQERLLRPRTTGRGPVPVAALVPMGRLRTMVDQAVITVRGPEDESDAAARVAGSLFVELVRTEDGATDLAARLAAADAARLDARLEQVAGWLVQVGDDRPKPVLRAVALGLLADAPMLRALDQLRREHGARGRDSQTAERAEPVSAEPDPHDVLAEPDLPPQLDDEPEPLPDAWAAPDPPPDVWAEPEPPSEKPASAEPEPGHLGVTDPRPDPQLLPQTPAAADDGAGGREPPDTLDVIEPDLAKPPDPPPELDEPPDPPRDLSEAPDPPRDLSEAPDPPREPPDPGDPRGPDPVTNCPDGPDQVAAARPAGVAGMPTGVWEQLAARMAKSGLPCTVLYVHLDAATGTWCEESTGALTKQQAMAIVGHSRVSVRPVLDLAANLTYTGYQAPPRLREQLAMLNGGYCTFPGCGRRARTGDVDHRDPWPRGFAHPDDASGEGGKTESRNTELLCRKHHRAKHSGWQVYSPVAGVWIWRSPAGAYYLVTAGATTPLNGILGPRPDADREHEVTHDFADIG